MAGFDMHVHSSASDGAMVPADLIVMAKKQGLLGMAITDHDTTAGFSEAAAKAAADPEVCRSSVMHQSPGTIRDR